MGTIILKVAPDQDLYVAWSSIVEAPVGFGTRAEMLADLRRDWHRAHPDCIPRPGTGPEVRLERADATGTSAYRDGDYAPGGWDDKELIYEQRGILARSKLGLMVELLAAERETAVWDLLEPFDGETEVRRG